MDEKRLKELGLDEATAKKVLDEIVSDKEKEGWIPKYRLDDVSGKLEKAETAKKDLEKQLIERDKQLEELSKSTKDSEEFKKQIKELQDANAEEKTKREAAEKEFAAKLKETTRAAIDERLLSGAKARNVKSAKALLKEIAEDLDDEKYAEEREKEIKALVEAEDSKFLFGAEETAGLQSRKPAGGGGAPPGTATFGETYAAELNEKNNPQPKQ